MIRCGGKNGGMKRRGRKGCAREKGDEKKLRKEIEINVRATNLDGSSSLL